VLLELISFLIFLKGVVGCLYKLVNSLEARNSSIVSLYNCSSVKAEVLPLSALTIIALFSFNFYVA
jgi:hypothetical protein